MYKNLMRLIILFSLLIIPLGSIAAQSFDNENGYYIQEITNVQIDFSGIGNEKKDTGATGFYSIMITNMQIVSFSCSFIYGPRIHDLFSDSTMGFILDIQPGLGGGKISAGFSSVGSSAFSSFGFSSGNFYKLIFNENDEFEQLSDIFIKDIFMGYSLKMAVLYTWANRWNENKGQVFIGPEMEITIFNITAVAGYLRNIYKISGDTWILSWGAGIKV